MNQNELFYTKLNIAITNLQIQLNRLESAQKRQGKKLEDIFDMVNPKNFKDIGVIPMENIEETVLYMQRDNSPIYSIIKMYRCLTKCCLKEAKESVMRILNIHEIF